MLHMFNSYWENFTYHVAPRASTVCRLPWLYEVDFLYNCRSLRSMQRSPLPWFEKTVHCIFCYRCMSSSNTVLVAHNGFAYDFLLLLAEIERRPKHLNMQEFVNRNVHFADTLPHLHQVQPFVHAYTCTYMDSYTWIGKERWPPSPSWGSKTWLGGSLWPLLQR